MKTKLTELLGDEAGRAQAPVDSLRSVVALTVGQQHQGADTRAEQARAALGLARCVESSAPGDRPGGPWPRTAGRGAGEPTDVLLYGHVGYGDLRGNLGGGRAADHLLQRAGVSAAECQAEAEGCGSVCDRSPDAPRRPVTSALRGGPA
jgi:hypothetical protein